MKLNQVTVAVACLLALSSHTFASRQVPIQQNGRYAGGVIAGTENQYVSASVEVVVRGSDGKPVSGTVVVSLVKLSGQLFDRQTTEKGRARFSNVPNSELRVQVAAPGYQTAQQSLEILDRKSVKVNVELHRTSGVEAMTVTPGNAALPPEAQKNIRTALDSLRVNKPREARSHLEAARRAAPNSAEVEYLFGMCALQTNDTNEAEWHWIKALEYDSKHFDSLLALAQILIRERKTVDAVSYLNRAVELDPLSWRAQALLAQACLMQGMREQAVQHGERAIELGKEDAAMVRPLLALALMQSGQAERAIHVLNDYVNGHAAEANASQIIASLTGPLGVTATPETIKSANDVPAISANTTAISMERNWLPPDVDETIPPVESGATCPLTDVLEKAGEQIKVLMHDVDRFTATESVIHESINKSGAPLAPEKRTFDYVVTIQEIRQGQLGVTEFRNGGGAQSEFPAGIATTGLPALVLIFHPYYVANYEMACEGLSQRNGLRVWQVHFLQRTGNGIKSYQFGINGPSYSVALKGRAWISAENYQIVRMETDLVAPMPDIRLFAEHTAVEYGPVQFRQGNVSLWLPQSADLYLDWRGRRMHRRHSFSQYQLFLVDENERISSPPNAQL